MGEGEPGSSWRVEALDAITDVVVAVDTTGTLVHVNPFAEQLLGHPAAEAVGRSIADFLHPDDLLRALEVMGEITGRSLTVPVTPAVYRMRDADGRWRPVEVNATPTLTGDDGEEVVVIVGRYSGDRDLQDQILEQLTAGRAPDEMIPLVPEFGLWRHPNEHYAVWWRDVDGERAVVGTEVLRQLIGEGTPDDGATPWARAARSGEEVLATDGELRALFGDRLDPSLGDCWSVPVDDPLHGDPAVIVAWSRGDGPAPMVHRYSIELMSRALSLLLQWRQQVVVLHTAARLDALTGVPNRVAFFELFDRLDLVGAGPPALTGVLYIDLDGFKAVNDDHGHRTGDEVLAQAATRMAATLRPGDTVARLGGDEFAVICHGIDDVTDAETIAARVIEAFEAPFLVDDLVLRVGASVGIAVRPTHEAVASELLHDADRALYRAKAEGRGTWRVT